MKVWYSWFLKYYATFSPHFGIGGGVGVDLEEEETFSLLIFWFDDDASFVLVDVLFSEESGVVIDPLFPFFALASAALSLTQVSPSAFAKWSSTKKSRTSKCVYLQIDWFEAVY